MKAIFAALALLFFLPTVVAQSPGQAQTLVSLPHGVEVAAGPNAVAMRVVANLVCDQALAGPGPLQVMLLAGAQGPDDGKGPAWTFQETSWNLTWTKSGGNYSIDQTFTVQVTGFGYGEAGVADEFSVGTTALRNASSTACTATGYTIPARSGHAHIQAGPRPAETKDAPTAGLPLLALGILLLVARRR